MKKIVLTLWATALHFSAQAQLFSPESFSGALWGSLIGGVVGGDCRHGFSGEGAAIGAAAGLVLGSIAELTTQKREQQLAVAQAVPAPPAYEHPAPMQPQQSQPASRQPDPKPQTRQTKPTCTAKGISASQPVF